MFHITICVFFGVSLVITRTKLFKEEWFQITAAIPCHVQFSLSVPPQIYPFPPFLVKQMLF